MIIRYLETSYDMSDGQPKQDRSKDPKNLANEAPDDYSVDRIRTAACTSADEMAVS